MKSLGFICRFASARFVLACMTLLIASVSLADIRENKVGAHDSKNPAAIPDQRCAMQPKDPYERPARISHRSLFFSGRCVNSERRRIPQAFLEQEMYGLTPVSNIRHAGQYWIAYLPLDDSQIESINFLILREKEVMVYSGHSQLEITFKKPVTLRLQSDFNQIAEVKTIYYSVEAVVPIGVVEQGKQNMIVSFMGIKRGMFPLVGRMATEQERQTEDKEKFWKFLRYPMILQNGEKAELVKSAILESDRFGFSRTFAMLESNCTSTIIQLVDKIPRIAAQNFPAFHHDVKLDPVLGKAIKALQSRGVIGPDPEVITDPKI